MIATTLWRRNRARSLRHLRPAAHAVCGIVLLACSGSPAPVDPETGERTPATFARSFGGGGYDTAVAAIPTSDGGYAFVGHWAGSWETLVHSTGSPTSSFERSGDIWIAKLDANGDPEWQRNIGERLFDTPDGSWDTPDDSPLRQLTSPMRRTPDGGFIVGGRELVRVEAQGVLGSDVRFRFLVVKLNGAGSVEWSRSYESGSWLQYEYVANKRNDLILAADDDRVEDIWPIPGGGYWVVGFSSASVRDPGADPFVNDDDYSEVPPGNVFHGAQSTVVLRLDDDGNVLAQRRFTEGQFRDRRYSGVGFAPYSIIRADTRGSGILVRSLESPLTGDDVPPEVRNVSLFIHVLGANAQPLASRTFALEDAQQRARLFPPIVDVVQTDDPDAVGVRDGAADDGFVILYGGGGGETILQKVAPVEGGLQQVWTLVVPTATGTFESVAQRCRSDVQTGRACDYVLGGRIASAGDRTEGAVLVASERGAILQLRRTDDLAPFTLTTIDAVRSDAAGGLTLLGGFDVPGGFENAGRRFELDAQLRHVVGSSVSFDRPAPDQSFSIYSYSPERAFHAALDADRSFVLSYLRSARDIDYRAFSGTATPQPLLTDLAGRFPRLGEERARGIVEVAPGSFVVAAETSSFSERYTERHTSSGGFPERVWLVRITNGRIDWQRMYAPRPDVSSAALGIAPSGDGGFVLNVQTGGGSGRRHRLVRFSAAGEVLAQSQRLSDELEFAPELDETLRAVPGGFLVRTAVGDRRATLALVDSALNIVWRRSFHPLTGGQGNEDEAIQLALRSMDAVDADADGAQDDGFVVLAAGPGVMQLLRLNPAGETLWAKTYAVPGANGSLADPRVRSTPGGGIVVAATSARFSPQFRTVDPVTGAVRARSSGESNITVLGLDGQGAIQWQRSYGALLDERLNGLEVLDDGGLLIAAASLSMGDSGEAWILRLGPDGLLADGCNAYLGAFVNTPAEATGVYDVAPFAGPSDVLPVPPPDNVPLEELDETGSALREEDLVSARQCLGSANPPGDPVPVPQFRLTILQAGTRSGPVTSTPRGIACGTGLGDEFCAASFPAGTLVTLTADVSGFIRFGEGCDQVEDTVCLVTLDADRTVPVIFGDAPAQIISLGVSGLGVVRDAEGAFECRAGGSTEQGVADCAEAFNPGREVVLTATPDAGESFIAWGWDCEQFGSQPSIRLRASQGYSCTARFTRSEPGTFALAVTLLNATEGQRVVSQPPGISCTTASGEEECRESYTAGTLVILEGEGAFDEAMGWRGCDRVVMVTRCEVTMNADRGVVATF